MLDLHAQSVPFHGGKAHEGMALACDTILQLLMDRLELILSQHPNYRLVILGYSLGAGVAQLVTLRLSDGPESKRIPESTKIYGLCYGPPPVYKSDSDDFSHRNIYCVINHNDGLATLSLHTLTKTFLQIRAIDRLKLKRRKVFKLLRTKIGNTVTQADGTRIFICDNKVIEEGGWRSIIDTMNLIKSTGFTRLDHAAQNIFLLKRPNDNDDFVVRHLKGFGETQNLSSGLKLRTGVFNDHMPWAYNSLFDGLGVEEVIPSLEFLHEL